MKNFAAATRGATAIEYALIVSLIVIVVIGAIRTTGTELYGLVDQVIPALR